MLSNLSLLPSSRGGEGGETVLRVLVLVDAMLFIYSSVNRVSEEGGDKNPRENRRAKSYDATHSLLSLPFVKSFKM